MNDNDAFLQQLAQGNTLSALNRLFTAGDGGGSEPMGLNRQLYGPPDEAAAEDLADVQARYLEQLSSAPEVRQAVLLYNLGCIALQQDEVSDARLRFSEVLELEPDHVMARHNLAYACELLAEFEEAEREYETVLAQNPELALSRLNLALLRQQTGDYEAALHELQALYNAEPENEGLLLYLCRALLTRGTTQDIEEVLELLETYPDTERYSDLRECRAYGLYLLGETDEAERSFTALLEENEASAFARMGLIKTLAARGDFRGLEPHARRYHELNPTEETAALLEALAEG